MRVGTVLRGLLLAAALSSQTQVAAAQTTMPQFGTNVLASSAAGNGAALLSSAVSAHATLARMFFRPADYPQATEPMVLEAATAGATVYPVMDLNRTSGHLPSDIADLRTWLITFAQRYGIGGMFWHDNPTVPYRPVTTYEIGNEPNCYGNAPGFPLDYATAGEYNQAYQAARTTLRALNPGYKAIVGGLLDAGCPISNVEAWAKAIKPAPDGIGFHPYVYSGSQIKGDTISLRRSLALVGEGTVPLYVDEFDSGVDPSWTTTVDRYVHWIACGRATGGRLSNPMHIAAVLPYYWEQLPNDTAWAYMVDSAGQMTGYGTGYLQTVRNLTTGGC